MVDMQLVQQTPLMPIGTAPTGTKLACSIVIGERKDGTHALELRLPSGVPLDANNPVHLFGLFIVNNAQQLMGLSREAYAQARAIQQTNEIIAAVSLPGA